MRKNLLRSLLGLICFVLLALFIHLKQSEDNKVYEVDETLRVHCPLQNEACVIHLGGDIKLDINLSPQGLPTFEPLTLKLKSEDIDFNQVKGFEAFFEGLEMEMGRHPFALEPISKSNVLMAVGSIPLCPMDPNMVWLLNIKFKYQNKMRLLKFEMASSVGHSS